MRNGYNTKTLDRNSAEKLQKLNESRYQYSEADNTRAAGGQARGIARLYETGLIRTANTMSQSRAESHTMLPNVINVDDNNNTQDSYYYNGQITLGDCNQS